MGRFALSCYLEIPRAFFFFFNNKLGVIQGAIAMQLHLV